MTNRRTVSYRSTRPAAASEARRLNRSGALRHALTYSVSALATDGATTARPFVVVATPSPGAPALSQPRTSR